MSLFSFGRGELFVRQMVRTPSAVTDPARMAQAIAPFGGAIKPLSESTLLLHRTDREMRGYLLARGDESSVNNAARQLAVVNGAEAVPVEDFDSVLTDCYDDQLVGRAVAHRHPNLSANPLASTDASAVASSVANFIPVGGWVAISMRRPSRFESRRWRLWLSHEKGSAAPTHPSLDKAQLVTAIWASAPDPSETRVLLEQVVQALPGFDVPVVTRVYSRLSAIAAPLALTALFLLGFFAARGSTPALAQFALFAAAASLLATIGRGVGVIPSWWSRTRNCAVTLNFPSPPRRPLPPSRPRKERTKNGQVTPARSGDYPLHRSSFMVGPVQIAGLVAPSAGVVSGQATTANLPVPAPLLSRIGPAIGRGGDKRPVYLSAPDAFRGTFITGSAGSGKSRLLLALYGWAALERVQPSGIPGWPGRNNSIIAFESKGGGLTDYEEWAAAVGDRIEPIDLADPATPAIDLFRMPGDAAERARIFVDAMEYAFEKGDIQGRSRAHLIGAFACAIYTFEHPEEILTGLPTPVPPNASIVDFAFMLLGGDDEELAKQIWGALKNASVQPGATVELNEAVKALMSLWQLSDSSRRNEASAPRNKVQELTYLKYWWDPRRPKKTWEQIISSHSAVIVNTGPSRNDVPVGGKTTKVVSSLMLYLLKHTIEYRAMNWQSQGRSVSIYSDELSLLAGSSADVVAWFKDQGRSFGVRPFFATQRPEPEQLNPAVLSAVLGFGTIIAFTQEDVDVAARIAKQVSGDDPDWGPNRVLDLEPFTALIRTRVDGRAQPPFVMPIADFVSHRHLFPVLQGYEGVIDQAPAPAAPIAAPVYVAESVEEVAAFDPMADLLASVESGEFVPTGVDELGPDTGAGFDQSFDQSIGQVPDFPPAPADPFDQTPTVAPVAPTAAPVFGTDGFPAAAENSGSDFPAVSSPVFDETPTGADADLYGDDIGTNLL